MRAGQTSDAFRTTVFPQASDTIARTPESLERSKGDPEDDAHRLAQGNASSWDLGRNHFA